jgi:hypothetical protein
LLADAVMLAHFGFLAFLAVGGFLARWWGVLVVPHVGAVLWGLASVLVGVECPLTVAEDRLRRLAGQPGLPGGFIDTYLAAVVSPVPRLLAVQGLVAALVVGSWVWLAGRGLGSRSAGDLSLPVYRHPRERHRRQCPPRRSSSRRRLASSCS